MFPYVFEAVEEEGNWFLLGSSPPSDEERIRELSGHIGVDLFRPEAPIQRPGEPDHDKLNVLTRTVQLVTRMLRHERASEGLEDLRGLRDTELLIVFAALIDEDGSLDDLAYRWHPVGLGSRNWIVRSAALDSLVFVQTELDVDKLKPEGIIACVGGENRLLERKAIEVVANSDRAILLPDEVIPRYAPLLLDSWRWREAVAALSSIVAEERHRDLLFDNMNAVYTKYLADPFGAPNNGHGYGFGNAIHDVARAVFDCRDVPDLLRRLSLPAGQCEFSLEALVALDCELPKTAVSAVKRLVVSDQFDVRVNALLLCRNLPVIDQEVTSLLLEATRDESDSIRGAALRALGDNRLADDLALELFTDASKDDSS